MDARLATVAEPPLARTIDELVQELSVTLQRCTRMHVFRNAAPKWHNSAEISFYVKSVSVSLAVRPSRMLPTRIFVVHCGHHACFGCISGLACCLRDDTFTQTCSEWQWGDKFK